MHLFSQFFSPVSHSVPLKKLFDTFWNKEVVNEGGLMVHHFIDHVDLGDDGLPPGFLHQGPDITDSKTNQEVHDHDREQEDIRSEEHINSA